MSTAAGPPPTAGPSTSHPGEAGASPSPSPAATPPPLSSAAPDSGPRSRRTAVLVIVAVACLGVATSALWVSVARTQLQLGRVTTTLSSSDRHLARVQVALDRTLVRLDAARAHNSSTAVALAQAQSQLAATRQAIDTGNVGIFLGQVDAQKLDQCLAAVEQALNQLAVGQDAGARFSLAAASTQCPAARSGG